MSNKIRIKRRASGNAGAPSSLENAELAYNEVDDVLYYGKGTGGIEGTATTVEAIGGAGAYLTLSGVQTITGNKTFSGLVLVPEPTANAHAVTKLYVDNAISGVTLSNTTVSTGSYGGANTVATFTVQSDGRLTAAGNTTISITGSQVSDLSTATVTSIAGTSNQISVTGTGAGPFTGAVTVSLPDNVTIGNTLTVTGDLVVNGNTTTLNTATLVVEDKNIVLANVETPTDTTADGAGISVLGATTKTFNWVDATDSWTSSEHLDLLAGKDFKISGASVLSNTTLGSSVIYSSLTTVGTIATGVWNGTAIGPVYGGTGLTTYATGDLVYASATNTLSARAAGTEGQFLKIVSGVPNWSDTVDGGTF
jgi:hypothetical protein